MKIYAPHLTTSKKIFYMQKNRYVVTMEFYMWAGNDETVIKEAKAYAARIEEKLDNQCQITNIVAQEFGHLGNRPVYDSAQPD
jgi:hypothetical protein